MKEVTLRLSDGQKLTFSNVEEISAFEIDVEPKLPKATEVTQKPQEGKWFCVNPLAIDQNLFKEKREDLHEERTRQHILKAFEEVKKNSKYTRPFKTMMPEKTWDSKSIGELKKLATKFGDHNADWVEQYLEWAQRIANGESWEDICHISDTANWHRLIVWYPKYGHAGMVGGAYDCKWPATCIFDYGQNDDSTILDKAVPLVVSYDV